MAYSPQLEVAGQHPQSVFDVWEGKRSYFLSHFKVADPDCEVFVPMGAHKHGNKVQGFDSTRRMQPNDPRIAHLPWNPLTKNTRRCCLLKLKYPTLLQ